MALPKTLAKPNTATIKAFAERGGNVATIAPKKTAPPGQTSGLVPAGDVRLTVNIRDDVHQRLKIRAVQERTTVGELIEAWVDGWK
jgi:hypothetical protein